MGHNAANIKTKAFNLLQEDCGSISEKYLKQLEESMPKKVQKNKRRHIYT